MFRVKICGVRLEQDVRAVARSGGDAVGLNFFPNSIRYLDPTSQSTAELSATAGQLGLLRVGVFVNCSFDSIIQIVDQTEIDVVQLHGDESLDLAKQLIESGQRVIRAIKLPKGPIESKSIQVKTEDWIKVGCHVLLDVDAGAAHGGSGKTLDWPSVRSWAQLSGPDGWTLAGGLKPENAGEAIEVSGANSVDTASGVECPRGVKNPDRIHAFVRAALKDG